MKIFKNKNNQIKNSWWVVIFFLVLASVTLPVIFISQHFKWEITMVHQAVIVVAVNFFCQFLRKKSFTEITGTINKSWFKKLFQGIVLGSLLMILPALTLYTFGFVEWSNLNFNGKALLATSLVTIGVAVAEEFLFRGFLFQCLKNWIGIWGAQLLIASYFLLTHINNPGMTGNIKIMASINIFLASIMFGIALTKSKSIAMPIGIHFAANWVQGILLGFGVSGHADYSILKANINNSNVWLTGGSFGLEASLPGLIFVLITVFFLNKQQSIKSN